MERDKMLTFGQSLKDPQAKGSAWKAAGKSFPDGQSNISQNQSFIVSEGLLNKSSFIEPEKRKSMLQELKRMPTI